MAILGATTLTGCLYIEGFLGGIDDGIPGGTTGYKCVFNQTNPPNSWTKETNLAYNDIALRVVTGPTGATFGGTTAFSTVLTTKSIGLAIQPAASAVTFQLSQPGGISGTSSRTIQNQTTTSSTTTSASLADLPLHDHNFQRNLPEPVLQAGVARTNITLAAEQNSGGAGSSQQHSHSVQFSVHSHGVSSNHTHTINAPQHPHTPPGPGTQENFAVLYRDVVIARKNVKP